MDTSPLSAAVLLRAVLHVCLSCIMRSGSENSGCSSCVAARTTADSTIAVWLISERACIAAIFFILPPRCSHTPRRGFQPPAYSTYTHPCIHRCLGGRCGSLWATFHGRTASTYRGGSCMDAVGRWQHMSASGGLPACVACSIMQTFEGHGFPVRSRRTLLPWLPNVDADSIEVSTARME